VRGGESLAARSGGTLAHLCLPAQRIVSHGYVVKWAGQRLQIPPQNRRFSFAGAKLQLYQELDGRVALYYGDTRLQHTTLGG